MAYRSGHIIGLFIVPTLKLVSAPLSTADRRRAPGPAAARHIATNRAGDVRSRLPDIDRAAARFAGPTRRRWRGPARD